MTPAATTDGHIDRVARMAFHCETAEAHLRDAEPLQAVREAHLVGELASPIPRRAEAELTVRALLAEVDGLELADQLAAAESHAYAAIVQANLYCVGGRMHALAELRLCETLEMQGRYTAAADGFKALEANVDISWGADIRMWCSNHMISTGVHSANRELQDEGINRGAAVRAHVDDPDQVASYLQWRGIAESRRHQAERAEATFAESFPLRDRTVRRNVTKGFLLADTAFAHGEEDAGNVLLQTALTQAQEAGLVRHARSARAHLQRFNPSLS